MRNRFIDQNRQFLLFSAVQAVLWIIFFLIVYTGHKQELANSKAFFSAIREVLIQMGVVYFFYLGLNWVFSFGKQFLLFLLQVASLILVFAALNVFLESFFQRVNSISLNFFGSTVTSFGLLLLSAPVKWSYDYFVLRQNQQEIANAQMETELKYLRLQINPHFLFNTLNNIYYLAEQKSDNTAAAISKLSELMRYLLEKKDLDEVPLKKEIDFIKAYLELEKMRVSGLNLNFIIDGETEHKRIPPMLILPLVENAFKHGIDKRSQDNRLNIHVTISNRLLLKIENTVSPSGANKVSKNGRGSGIKNLEKRLEVLFPDDHLLSTEMKDIGFFKAKLEIPLL